MSIFKCQKHSVAYLSLKNIKSAPLNGYPDTVRHINARIVILLLLLLSFIFIS